MLVCFKQWGWSLSVTLIKAGVELLHRRTRTREGQQSAARTCASSSVIIWSNILWGTFLSCFFFSFFFSLHAFQHNNTNDPPAECRKFKLSLIYLTSLRVLSPSPFIYVDELRFFHVALLNTLLLPKSLAVHLQRRSSWSGNSVGPQAAGGWGWWGEAPEGWWVSLHSNDSSLDNQRTQTEATLKPAHAYILIFISR